MKRIGLGFALIAIVGVTACQSGLTSGPVPDQNTIAERSVGEYQLGGGDELRVTVFGEPDLSGQYMLDGNGMVSLPLIGQVSALNLSISEFQSAVEARYADGYLRAPRVNAEVMNYRPYYILGEIRAPGEYPYSNGLTVINAVATAGGFTYRANQKVIMIKGADDAAESRVELSASTQILPGDTIRVVERFF